MKLFVMSINFNECDDCDICMNEPGKDVLIFAETLERAKAIAPQLFEGVDRIARALDEGDFEEFQIKTPTIQERVICDYDCYYTYG